MYKLEMRDPYRTGTIEDEVVVFDFYSEDKDEWERLADEALAEQGWERVRPWDITGTFVTRKG